VKTYFDVQGDGGSGIVAQVTAQREAMTAALAGVRHVVLIGSGKGGVGKSTATMALGQSLRRRGKTVAILDADLNGPCQAQMAGLEGAPWVPGLRGLAIPRRRDGLGVVSCGSFLEGAASLELPSVAQGDEHVWRATRELTTLGQLVASIDWGSLDVLLVDLPPGTESTRQHAAFLGPRVVLVLLTIPTDVARGVVARSLAALRRDRAVVLGQIENMAGYYHRAEERILPLFPPPRRGELELPLLGRIPFDPELARLCDAGWPSDAELSPPPGLEEATDNLLQALAAAEITA